MKVCSTSCSVTNWKGIEDTERRGIELAVFAQRMKTMERTASIIRGLFGTMNDPGIISFGGDSPAREALPVDIVREIAKEVIRTDSRGVEALQYGSVSGLMDLREAVSADPSNILITSS